MRFAAAALLAGMLFLAVAFSGFGSAPLGPRDIPQAIRLSDVSAGGGSAPNLAVPLPDAQPTPDQATGSAPPVAVAHKVVSVPLGSGSSSPVAPAAPTPSASTEQLPAPVFEIAPAPPVVTTTTSPDATPTPTPTPSATPTPTPTPSPSPSPSPSPTKTGLLRTILNPK